MAVGIMAALLWARATGEGQVIDVAMTDGSALLMTLMYGMHHAGSWSDKRSDNLLDGGAPFYDVYEVADGYVAVGGIESKFYAAMLHVMGIDDVDAAAQYDVTTWPALRLRLAAEFRLRTRAEWEEVFSGSEACVTPILDMTEAAAHAHNRARGTFTTMAGASVPAPAPRFSATPTARPTPPRVPGSDSLDVLAYWGLDDRATELIEAGVVRQA